MTKIDCDNTDCEYNEEHTCMAEEIDLDDDGMCQYQNDRDDE